MNEDKSKVVLDWLRKTPGTVDEFIRETGFYVNSWAPTFTRLYQRGRIRPVGHRTTSHGGTANVWEVVQ